ncbi:MAG: hypothetical protein ABEJ98_02195 [Candidatus Nanohaloarchaea archaeon]
MKKILAVLSLIAVASTAAALTFEVGVPPRISGNEYALSYENNTSSIHRTELVVENDGSVGCLYRLEGTYRYGNSSVERYSPPLRLWPGETGKAVLKFVAVNYTGEITASINLSYCGREDQLKEFSFNYTEKVSPAARYDSVTVEANRSAAKIKLESFKEAVLVPVEAPPKWKPSSATLNQSKAVIEYSPPLFARDEKMTYAVVSGGQVVGSTQIGLHEQKTLLERIGRDDIAILLAVSLLFNMLSAVKLSEREK